MIALVAAAFAADTADWHAAQARQFLKKGWTADAEAEVAAGLALDPHHVELDTMCVDLARAAGDITRAITCAAAGAAATEGDLDARARLSQTETWLRENFGWVEVHGPDGVVRARLVLEATSMQLDAALQTAAADAAARLRAGTAVPVKVALPIGDYTLLGEPVHVEAAQTRVLTLPAEKFAAAAGRGRRVDVGAGVLVFSGEDFANQTPGATVELTASFPVGATRLALGAAWDARGYTGESLAPTPAPDTAGGLVRWGAPLEVGGAVFLVPAVAVRVAMLPGLELACADSTTPLACTPGAAGEAALPIYAHGVGVIPEAELGGEYVRGRLVVGLRGSVGHVFGLLPDPGQLRRGDALLTWHSDRPVLHAGVYRLTASAGWGF
jgi:hypothetical protein